MKKYFTFILLSLFAFKAFAQADQMPRNEVKLNLANTIAIASVEVGYERFLGFHQSLEAEFLINDRINYHTEKGSREFKTNSFKLGYNYYFGEMNPGSGIYVSPFLKLRTGDFEEISTKREDDVSFDYKKKTDMGGIIIGFGLGYKWNFTDTFIIAPYANVGRNFSDEVKERFSAIEFNAGVSVGYRF